jgi:diguanylate cyclase
VSVTGIAFDDTFTLGARLLRAGQSDEALEAFRTVYIKAEADKNIGLMAACLNEMAWSSYRMGDAEQGIEYAMAAKWRWRSVDNAAEQARALAIEAILFLDLGFSDEAYTSAHAAVELAQSTEFESVQAFALNAKGIVLAVCHEAQMGIDLLEHAIKIAARQRNIAAQAYYLLNLGFCHAKLAEELIAQSQPEGAADESRIATEMSALAVDLAERVGDQWTLRTALSNSAELLATQGRHCLALELLERFSGLAVLPGTGLRIHFLYTLSDVLLRSGQVDKAYSTASEALALAEHCQLMDHQVNAAIKLVEILEKLGDTRAAFAMHRRYHALYVRQSGDTARRRARIEEIRSETDRLRDYASALADQVLCDPLTGIANRRSFDQILNRLAGSPIAIAMVDLDLFKAINDQFSHLVGDSVLQRVAKIMVSQIGPHGHVARLGGEEFTLIFPDAAETSAAAFCEGVRIAIASTDWSDLGEGLSVTVSIGLAVGRGEVPSGLLLQMADRRLYMAKAAGRDRVVSQDAPVLVRDSAETRKLSIA